MLTYTLVPAYGRDYRTAEEVARDWHAGKDFEIATVVGGDCGRMCSIRDLFRMPGSTVKIRFNGKRDAVIVNVTSGVMTDEAGNIVLKPAPGPSAYELLKTAYQNPRPAPEESE